MYITTFTLPTNRELIASFSSLIPVINSSSSSLTLTIFANGKNSNIASLHFSGDSHKGNLMLGSKLTIQLLFLANSIAFLCAFFIGASIKLTEQKCNISPGLKSSSTISSSAKSISALGFL